METLYLASSEEPNSLENKLKDHDYKEGFLNSSHKITDIRMKEGSLSKNSTNVQFDSKNERVVAQEPSSEGDILNIMHSVGIYYETLLRDNLKDGKVDENSNILDRNGNVQTPNPPKIEFSEFVEASSDEIFLDHPERISGYFWNEYLKEFDKHPELTDQTKEFLRKEEFENVDHKNFKRYNQGTDFIILNKEKLGAKRMIQDFAESLPKKAAHVIKYINKEDESFSRGHVKSDYIEFLPRNEKIKVMNKMQKPALEVRGGKENTKRNYHGYSSLEDFLENEAGRIILSKELSPVVPIDGETGRDYIQRAKEKFGLDGSLSSHRAERDYLNLYEKELNEEANKDFDIKSLLEMPVSKEHLSMAFDFINIGINDEQGNLKYKEKKDLEWENILSLGTSDIRLSYMKKSYSKEDIPEKVRKDIKSNMNKAVHWYPLVAHLAFENFPEREDFIRNNWETFKDYIESVKKDQLYMGYPGPLLHEWMEIIPETKDMVSEEELEKYLSLGIGGLDEDVKGDRNRMKDDLEDKGKRKLSNYPFFKIYRQINFGKAKRRAIKYYNEQFSKTTNFEAESTLEKMKNKSFFAVPTFVNDFRNKQYKRLVEQLGSHYVPYVQNQNFMLVYDTANSQSISREIIPEQIRNEFSINSFSKDDKASPQKGYYGHEGPFSSLNRYIELDKKQSGSD